MSCPFKIGDIVHTRRPGWDGDDIVKVTYVDDDYLYGILIDSCDKKAMRYYTKVTCYKTGWDSYSINPSLRET